MINDKAIILFLDFYKAFDTVEHELMFESLCRFGFGHSYVKIVQTFYKNNNSNVSLVNGVSPRFVISRGIRQGCPISPFLFLLVAEFLNIFIPDGNILSTQIWHMWNDDLAHAHVAWNDGTWADRSCLPDLGQKQAIAMTHVSQEQRNKPHWTFSEPQNLHILFIESSQLV